MTRTPPRAAAARATVAVGTISIIAAAATGCSGSSSDAPERSTTTAAELSPDSTEVTYTYTGPSTPPPYHDEYRIVIAHGTATITVGTYGTVAGTTAPRATETKTVDAAHWRQLVAAMPSLPDGQHHGEPGCSGGSTYGATVASKGTMIKAGSTYACGSDHARLAGPFTDFIAPITALFDMDHLLTH